MLNAVLLEKEGARTLARLASVDESALGEGNVTVGIEYSTLNYKDALAITGRGPVVRKFPMVPGIDFAGRVESSEHPGFKVGEAVILNGFGAGETHWGGLAQRARVSGDFLLPLPKGLTSRQAMAIGTAGYTAMLAVQSIEKAIGLQQPSDVLVTGAAGGVGGFAIAILARAGHRVFASTGRAAETPRLRTLGAAEVLDRATLSAPGKALASERWDAVIDCVGSHTLANACAATRYGGAVAACGLAQGMDFPATVAPFILRGIHLIGIDSVFAPRAIRKEAWKRLAADLDTVTIESLAGEVTLAESIGVATALLDGNVKGRVIVDVNR